MVAFSLSYLLPCHDIITLLKLLTLLPLVTALAVSRLNDIPLLLFQKLEQDTYTHTNTVTTKWLTFSLPPFPPPLPPSLPPSLSLPPFPSLPPSTSHHITGTSLNVWHNRTTNSPRLLALTNTKSVHRDRLIMNTRMYTICNHLYVSKKLLNAWCVFKITFSIIS